MFEATLQLPQDMPETSNSLCYVLISRATISNQMQIVISYQCSKPENTVIYTKKSILNRRSLVQQDRQKENGDNKNY